MYVKNALKINAYCLKYHLTQNRYCRKHFYGIFSLWDTAGNIQLSSIKKLQIESSRKIDLESSHYKKTSKNFVTLYDNGY